MTERCDNCRFWLRRSDERGKRGGGYCRRFPPFAPSAITMLRDQLIPSDEYLNDAWPMVGAQSWCGEYAALSQKPGEQG